MTKAMIMVLDGGGQVTSKSYKQIDTASEEYFKGISFNTNRVEYDMFSHCYTLVEFPEYADYVENLITGAAKVNVGILVISATEGCVPDINEHIFLAKQGGVSSFVVFLNKEDMMDDEELLELIEIEIQQMLSRHNFSSDEIRICRGSGLQALDKMTANSKTQRGDDPWVDQIYHLLEVVDVCSSTSGQVIANSSHITSCSQFRGQLYIFPENQGGKALSLGDNSQLCIKTSDARSTIASIINDEVETAMPDSYIRVTTDLVNQIAVCRGTRFALCEDDHIIGIGVVSKILD